MSGYSDEIGYL